MAFDNLPGIFTSKIDGNLQIAQASEAPIVTIIGTSPSGPTDAHYRVDSISQAASLFGRTDGTLVRGMYEVYAGGAQNLRLMRIGAASATLTVIGGGVTLETVKKDDNAGLDYKLFWEDSTGRLRVWRTSDNLLVYDNNPVYPSGAIDENEVSVSGSTVGNPGDIGSLATPITMAAANGVSGAVYTPGTDGLTLSRMRMYEELFNAYRLLQNEDIDHVVPMNVYLDDLNVDDMTTAQVSTLNTSAPWAGSSVYPTAGTSFDALGEVFVQEYQGKWYFWWDMDRDGVAEIYPTVGTASTDAYGDTLSASDFHPVNFAYQLGNFCYTQSQNNSEMMGFIGVLPPTSWSLSDVAAWIGDAPVSSEDANGNLVITTNGTGLLGNRWMAGRKGSAGTGLPGHIVSGIDGLLYGGFVATGDGWLDGAQEVDRNGHIVDMGKYLNVVGAQGIMANVSSPTAYAATVASAYAGFVTTLPANSAPTNKVMQGCRMPFRISVSKLDTLAGFRYVMLQAKSKGVVIADAPTAARPDSDYQRLSTVRIVKSVIDSCRVVADPFLGEGMSGARFSALETAIDSALAKLKELGYLRRYDKVLTSTPSQRIQGQASLELVLIPSYELRQLTIYIALAAQ